jgi:hypothetical protein
MTAQVETRVFAALCGAIIGKQFHSLADWRFIFMLFGYAILATLWVNHVSARALREGGR